MSYYQPYYDCLTQSIKSQNIKVEQLCNMLISKLPPKDTTSQEENVATTVLSESDTDHGAITAVMNQIITNPESCISLIASRVNYGEGHDQILTNLQANSSALSHTMSDTTKQPEEFLLYDKASDNGNIYLMRFNSADEIQQFQTTRGELIDNLLSSECENIYQHGEL